MSNRDRMQEIIGELRDFRACGPSDDPDEQTAVAVAYRYLVVQLQYLANQIVPGEAASQLQAVRVDVQDIYSVYEARAHVDALLPDLEDALARLESREAAPPVPGLLDAVRQLLHARGRDDLVALLSRVDLDFDVSSNYGSFWNSYDATAEFRAPIEDCDRLRDLPQKDVELILEMIREIHPPHAGDMDVSSIEFLVDPACPSLLQLEDVGGPTGWDRVDRCVLEVRDRLRGASTEEQCQSVGHLCREALISVAQAVFDPSVHRSTDGVDPSDTDAKRMLDAYLEHELAGASNKEARRHARASLDLANKLQHDRTATHTSAMLCAEATVSVVNIVAIVSGKRSHPR